MQIVSIYIPSVNPGYKDALYSPGILKYDWGMIKKAVNSWSRTLHFTVLLIIIQ